MKQLDTLRQHHIAFLIAALAGAANVFAFAPFGIFILPVVTLALLLWLLLDAAPRRAAWLGFTYGAAWFAAGTYWLYISLHEFGEAPAVLAVLLMLVLIAIMAAYYALFAWLTARFAPRAHRPVTLLAWTPALWALLEWIRGWFLSGFPWFALGYSQTDSWLAGFAPALGVFGVSFMVALLAGALALLLVGTARQRIAAILVVLLVPLAAQALRGVAWTAPAGEPVSVALVQGNVPQDQKWLPENRIPTLERYWSLTEDREADLVVWPEAAIPALYHRLDRAFYAQVEDELLDTDQRLLTGTLVHDWQRNVYFNSAVVLGASARRFYHKRHLVPFGEYFPVPDFVRDWLRLMNLPYSDFETGTDGSALTLSPDLAVAVMICYEAVFGEELISALPAADLVVNISNDGWFGRSIGPLQHFQVARMRAIETGRWLLRATNTGVTAIVDNEGRVRDRLPQFETAVLEGEAERRTGATPYVRFGNLPLVMCCLLLVAGVLAFRRARP